jgi:hypothetical protein
MMADDGEVNFELVGHGTWCFVLSGCRPSD